MNWWLLIVRRWFFFAIAVTVLGSAAPPASHALTCGNDCPPRLVYASGVFFQETWLGHPSEVTAPPPTPAPTQPEPSPKRNELPETAPPAAQPDHGDVRVVVSLPLQRAYVFKGGELFGTSPVSTGKPGHRTPTGTFPITQKKVHHRSNLYDNAPMPFMQRLTNGGIALHAGDLPGYPASHGCIRLPWSFAKKLYDITRHGTPVTVTDERPESAEDALKLA